MTKASRRVVGAVAAAAAASLAFAGTALAAPSDSYQDDRDGLYTQYTIDNNLDNLFRVAGPDRISTAIKLMESSTKWRYCGWDHKPPRPRAEEPMTADQKKHHERNCDTVIVARSDEYPDALAAGPLADVYDAPILLTGAGGIDSRVLAAIDEFGFRNAILVGGTAVFPSSAMQALEGVVGVGDVQQVGGINRYETATDIARHVGWRVSGKGVNPYTVNVYLATGENFPDALAAGAAAADNDGVVLLTNDTRLSGDNDASERFTLRFLEQQAGWNSIFGYPVFNKVEIHTVGGQAEAATTSAGVSVADTNTGANRYETATMLFYKYKNGIDKVAVVSGQGFADGVAAGGWVANHDGALLLTNNDHLNSYTKTALATVADTNVDVVVVGGPGAVSRAVSDQIAEELYTW